MASLYQRATGRRQFNSAGRDGDTMNWPPKEEALYQQSWTGELQDEPKAGDASRSRSRTMNSVMSFYAASNSDSSNAPSRAVSPHLTRDRHIPALERTRESTGKSLLSKGSQILRKHSSKFSLNSLSTMDSDTSDRHIGRSGIAYSANLGKDRRNAIDTFKREELKRTISEPFDFQHQTHLDRVFLNSMQRITKNELVGEFSAVRAGQASKPQLRGIRAEALPSQKPIENQPTSPVSKSPLDTLLQTPPRPTPPPKDVDSISPTQLRRMSRSVDNFSRPTTASTSSQISPPQRYSSRRALQTSANSPFVSLGSYLHSPSHSLDTHGLEEICSNCEDIEAVENKPLPGLPPIHAVTTNDDSARQLRVAPLPQPPLNLADVPEENGFRLSSAIECRVEPQKRADRPMSGGDRARGSDTARTNFVREEKRTSQSTRAPVVDDWDDAIDDSWLYAAAPEAVDVQCLSSMSAQVASFVDKAMTRLTGHEQMEESSAPQADPTGVASLTAGSPHSSTAPDEEVLLPRGAASYPDSSPLLGLGIELHQGFQEVVDPCVTPTPASTSVPNELIGRDPSLTASFQSDLSPVSGISKSSSQESIIWSIASSIMGTERSSNSSSSLLEHLPDYYLQTAKSSDDLNAALQSVQEHLQELHEKQLVPSDSLRELDSSRRHSHEHGGSLATDFVFATSSSDLQQGSMSRQGDTLGASHGHQRDLSAPHIPIPARKSSVMDQAEAGRPPARRMRSATTTTRSKHSSRASYSLFPGTCPGSA